ncbi:MAG: LamG-like jellyroll fold domain-containing protein [Bacteroidota bacterium]|nr:LamG-like jellyroll fold domain-containing protein [Bacteroidota bacterium]
MKFFKIFLSLSLLSIFLSGSLLAQTTYYSQTGLPISAVTSWWTNTNNTGSHPANFTSGDIFIIQFGHTMSTPSGSFSITGTNSELQINGTLNIFGSVTAALLTVQYLKVSATGILNINSGSTLIVNNSPNVYDLVVDGTLNNSSTISIGPIIYNSGAAGQINGTYDHQVEGDTIPTFNWGSGSLCRISGLFYAANLYGLNQNFYNFTYDCINSQVITNFNSQLTNVSGLFKIQATGGAGSINLFNTNNAVLNAGEFSLISGTLTFNPVGSGFIDTIRITKDGGSFSQSVGSTINTLGGSGAFHFVNDNQFGSTGGTIGSNIGFRVSKYFAATSGVTTNAPFVVDSGATLYIQGNGTINGTGSFNLNSGATLRIENINGITSSGGIGAIQVTGSRIYNSGGSFEYSRTSAQNTGNGLPSSLRKLVIDNPSVVTLTSSVAINDTLTLNAGQFDIGTKVVTIDGPVSTSGSGYFISGSTGTVNYNFASDGQYVVTNNSQYGNLAFNNFSKVLDNNSLLISGTFTTGTATHSVGVVNAIEFNGTGPQTIPPFNYAHLWITGTRGVNYVTLSNADIIYISGSFNPTATFIGGDYVTTGTTIDFNGGNSQTIPSFPYDNLTISGARNSNDVIFSGVDTIFISGNFNPTATFSGGDYITTGATIDFNGFNSQTIPSFHYDNLIISGARDTDNVTLNNSDTIFIAGIFSPIMTFTAGNLITVGTIIDFNGFNSQTIPSFHYDNLIISGARGTNNVTLTNSDTIFIAGIFSPIMTFTSGNLITIGSTIEFDGLISQTIPAFEYYNLIISGARSANDVVLSNSNTIFIAGVFSPIASFASGNFITTGSTVEFNGGNSATVPSLPGGTPYHNIIVNKNDGGLNAGDHLTLNGDLTLLLGDLYDNGYIITVNGNIFHTNGYHTSTGGGKILLTGGSSEHLIGDAYLGTLEIDDPLGASTTGSPSINNLILTNGIFILNSPLNITNGGTISATLGDLSASDYVIFNGTGTVAGTVSFNPVVVNGPVDFGTGSTISGFLSINPGGSVATNPPTFANGSTLYYSTGGTFNRGVEMSSTTGAGYPHHVNITNSTVLNLAGLGESAIAREISGNLTIDSASMLTMNQIGSEMTAPLTVNGYIFNKGTLALSSLAGGNLWLRGDYIDQFGILTSNSSSVNFIGSSKQKIERTVAGYITFDSLIIASSDTVEVDPSVNLQINNALDIQSGVLNVVGGVVDFANGTSLANYGGMLVPANHVFSFNGSATITGIFRFWNVNISGSVNFGSASSIVSELKIQSGGLINSNAPSYEPGSTLTYFSGGIFKRGLEWNALSGPGYPHHIQISNTTLLNIGDYFGLSIPLQTGGNITNDAASEISMNVDGQEMLWPLTVNGNLINNGTVTLAGIYNGSLILKGDLTNNGSLISNNRPVIFSGSSNQLITRDAPGTVYFDSLIIDKSAGIVEVVNTPLVALSINSNLTLQNGLLRLNGTITDIAAFANIEAVSGNFDTLTNVINFYGVNTIIGTVDFQNINLYGGVNFQDDSKLHGTMNLMSGGTVSINPPIYLSGSTLIYYSGGIRSRGVEWSALSGQGYPFNVILDNNTLLNFGSYNTTDETGIGGNLVIMGGSTLHMYYGEGDEMSAPLSVSGSVENYGSINLSYLPGNDLNIQKNLIQSDAILTPNGNAISFVGTGNSTIDGIGTLDKLRMDKSSGVLTLGNDLVINDTLFLNGGNIKTDSFAVEMPNASNITRTIGHINGNLRKYIPTGSSVTETFEIGDSIVYSPVSVSFSNITANDYLTASTSISGPSLTGTNINESKNVNRFWTLSPGVFTFDSFNSTFTFDSTDIDSSANTSDFTLWRHNGSNWNDIVEGTRTATSTQGTGIDGFGTFAVGQLITYTITPTASANGSISPNIATEVPFGGNLNVTITPDTGSHIDSVLVDGVSLGPVTSYDFINVNTAHTIDAYFSINTHVISTNINGTGTITPLNPVVPEGNNQQLFFSPGVGNHLDSVIIDGVNVSSVPSYTFSSIAASHIVDAYFSPNVELMGEYISDANTLLLMHFNEVSGSIVPDYSTNVNSGTAIGTTVGGGRFGNARNFNGSSDYIESQPSVIPPSGDFTVDMWVNGVSTENTKEIYGQGRTGDNTWLGYENGYIRAQGWGLIDSIPFPFNAWHHLALVKTNSNTYFYIDGVQRAERGVPMANPTQADPLIIGSQFDLIGEYWQGKIDEFRVSNIARDPSTFNLQLPPKDLSANVTGTTIDLNWLNGGGGVPLQQYYIYRGSDSTTLALLDSTTNISYADTGLTSSTEYFYRVTAYDSTGFESVDSYALNVMTNDVIPPSAPQNLAVSAGDGQVILNWNPNSEIDFGKYYIYVDTSLFPTTIVDSTIGGVNDTLKLISGLMNYQQYYFRITAADISGNISGFSDQVGAMTTDTTKPDVPQNLIATAGDNQVTIHWNPISNTDFAKYYIYAGTSPNPTALYDSLFAINDTIKVFGGLQNYVEQYFRVTAVDSNGNMSGYSNEVSAIPNDMTPPAAPVNLVITDSIANNFTITWYRNSENDIAKYYIYRDTLPNPSTLVDSSVNNVDTVRTFTSLSIGQQYFFRVAAVDTNNNVGSLSNEVNATPYMIYAINASAIGNGTISPDGISYINHGDSLVLTMSAAAHHHIDSIDVDSIITSGLNDTLRTYTFMNVIQEHSIVSYFSINSYTISASAIGNGTISPVGNFAANYGDTIAYGISPNAYHHLDSVLVDGIKVDSTLSYTFIYVTSLHTIDAYFSPNVFHHFIVEANGGGPISPQIAGQNFTIRTTAVDSLENPVDSFTGNVWFSSTDSTIGVAGGNYSIPFIAGQHGPQIVSLYRSGNHTISVIDSISGKTGTSIPFIINPAGLSHFTVKDTFGLDISQKIKGYPFSVKITAVDAYNNIQNDYVGSVDVSISGGAPLTQGGGTSPNFNNGILSPYIIAIDSSGFFSINVSDNLAERSGASNFFLTVPNTNSIFAAAVNGSITPLGEHITNYGDTVTFTFAPNIRHHFDSILVDGVAVNDSTSQYTFTNVTSVHIIIAFFSPNLNNPPIFTTVMNDTAFARFDTLHFNYIANDPESGLLRYAVDSSPSGVSIDSVTGQLTYIPAANANGSYDIIVKAYDDSLVAVFDTVKVRVNIYGDVSGNGTISAFDGALVLQDVVDTTKFTLLQKRVGDVNGTGIISPLDASLILQRVVGLIPSFPGGLGKQAQAEAVLSAFSFRIQKGEEENVYNLFVSIRKPSQVFGIAMSLSYDSTIVKALRMNKTELTDSMMMAYHFPDGDANLALAGISPLNNAGDIMKFSFTLKDPNYPKNAVLFTMKKFILNETDHAKDIGGISLNVRDLAQLPTVYKLEQNFPNPFNPTTTINYQLPDASSVKIIIYNMLGQEIKTLISEQQLAGYYSMMWNGTDNANRKISSGVYIYRIEAIGPHNKRYSEVKKMLMIK